MPPTRSGSSERTSTGRLLQQGDKRHPRERGAGRRRHAERIIAVSGQAAALPAGRWVAPAIAASDWNDKRTALSAYSLPWCWHDCRCRCRRPGRGQHQHPSTAKRPWGGFFFFPAFDARVDCLRLMTLLDGGDGSWYFVSHTMLAATDAGLAGRPRSSLTRRAGRCSTVWLTAGFRSVNKTDGSRALIIFSPRPRHRHRNGQSLEDSRWMSPSSRDRSGRAGQGGRGLAIDYAAFLAAGLKKPGRRAPRARCRSRPIRRSSRAQ